MRVEQHERNNTVVTNTHNLPASWAESEQLDGLDLIDKAELVGRVFRVTGFYFTSNDRDISYAYVDGEDTDGNTFSFNDSSTGVRAQLVEYLKAKGNDAAIDTGEYVKASIVIPKGLRVSEFTVKDERGRDKNARTYYLTTSGKRAGADTAAAPKTRTRR